MELSEVIRYFKELIVFKFYEEYFTIEVKHYVHNPIIMTFCNEIHPEHFRIAAGVYLNLHPYKEVIMLDGERLSFSFTVTYVLDMDFNVYAMVRLQGSDITVDTAYPMGIDSFVHTYMNRPYEEVTRDMLGNMSVDRIRKYLMNKIKNK